MPIKAIPKYPSTGLIKNTANDAGIGMVSGSVYIHDGTNPVKHMHAGEVLMAAGNSYKLARGQHTTVAAVDTVVTGLTTVVAVIAGLDANCSDNILYVSASIGDQSGSPAAGSIYIKSWKPTNATNDATPAAATTLGGKANWIAIGT